MVVVAGVERPVPDFEADAALELFEDLRGSRELGARAVAVTTTDDPPIGTIGSVRVPEH